MTMAIDVRNVRCLALELSTRTWQRQSSPEGALRANDDTRELDPLTSARLWMLPEGIDWRAPQPT